VPLIFSGIIWRFFKVLPLHQSLSCHLLTLELDVPNQIKTKE